MNGDAFSEFKLRQYPAQCALHGGFIHGAGGGGPLFAAAAQAGEDPNGVAVQLPVSPQGIKGVPGHWNVTVLCAFTTMDMDAHAVTADIADLNV